MKNERLTEQYTEEKLKEKGWKRNEIIPQKSKNPKIIKLLEKASKSGTGYGKPDYFLIRQDSPILFIIECKAKISNHKSNRFLSVEETMEDISNYACDGVIHYASYLKDEYDVIAIAVSGSDDSGGRIEIDTFLWKKEDNEPINLDLHELCGFEQYVRLVMPQKKYIEMRLSEVMSYARTLHDEMRDYANMTEAQKPLLVSGILIALQDDEFRQNYNATTRKGEYLYPDQAKTKNKSLAEKLHNAIETVLTDRDIKPEKVTSVMSVYSFIKGKNEFKKSNQNIGINPLRKFIEDIEKNVRDVIIPESSIDVIGKFYGEFIRYTGGDGKGLGIVLTPHHIADLFCKITNVTPDTKVLDICTGSGAFLISAMKTMIEQANGNTTIIDKIKRENLVGVEQQPEMFALAASNMILRNDGQSNLYTGSCFDFQETLTSKHCNVGLINPPYSQKGEGLSELDFIDYLLDCLEPGGIGAAIVPMSCAIDTKKSVVELKRNMMRKHTLLGVMSMPEELFYPVGVVTCIMVWQAHRPHDKEVASWFGYWKDDGFVKTKKDGRIDKDERWNEIEKKWLMDWKNRNERPGECVKHCVGPEDEWCAEAYLETDYSKLTKAMFEEQVKKYAIFKLMNT